MPTRSGFIRLACMMMTLCIPTRSGRTWAVNLKIT
nr:MAG TPA: hypothetical protein [Caudoviricetes sp.]